MCVFFKLLKSGSFDPNYYKTVFLFVFLRVFFFLLFLSVMLGTEPRTKSKSSSTETHTHSGLYFKKNNVLTGNYGMLRMEK